MTQATRRMVRQRTDAIPVSDEPTFGGPTKFNGSVKELVQYYNYNPVQDAGDFGKDFTGKCQFKIGHPDMSPRLDDIDGNWTDKRLANYKNYIPYDGVSPKYTFGKPSTICDKVDDCVHAKWQHEYHNKMEEKQNHIAQTPREQKMQIYSSSHDKTVNTRRNFCPKENVDLSKTGNAKQKVKRMALNKNFFLNKIQCAETSKVARAGYIGEQMKSDHNRAMRYVKKDRTQYPSTSRPSYSEEPQITGDSSNFQNDPTKTGRRFAVKSFYKKSNENVSVDRLPSIINTDHKPVCIPSRINQTEYEA